MSEAEVDKLAEKLGDAYEEWALTEIKQVGQRNFEMSKHLFAVSAGSFAIFPFLGQTITHTNYFHIVGLFLLGCSVVVAILLAEPPNFKVNGTDELVIRHTGYSIHRKSLRHFWLVIWLLGIVLIFLASRIEAGIEIGMSFGAVVNH